MDGITWSDQEAMSPGQVFFQLQSPEPGEKGPGEAALICEYVIAGNIFYQQWFTSEISRQPRSNGDGTRFCSLAETSPYIVPNEINFSTYKKLIFISSL